MRVLRVSQNAEEGTKQLFDQRNPHLPIWLWIHDPTVFPWECGKRTKGPLPPRGTPLRYAAFCGLHDVVKILAIEHSPDVDSPRFTGQATPLLLASGEVHVEVARILVEHGADAAVKDKDG